MKTYEMQTRSSFWTFLKMTGGETDSYLTKTCWYIIRVSPVIPCSQFSDGTDLL